MEEQKVVICTDFKTEVQTFLSKMNYDKLFILTDENTLAKCYPLIKDIPVFHQSPAITIKVGDMNKNVEQLSIIWTALSNGGASRNSMLVNLGGGMSASRSGISESPMISTMSSPAMKKWV